VSTIDPPGGLHGPGSVLVTEEHAAHQHGARARPQGDLMVVISGVEPLGTLSGAVPDLSGYDL
jgi:hypothetical protein